MIEASKKKGELILSLFSIETSSLELIHQVNILLHCLPLLHGDTRFLSNYFLPPIFLLSYFLPLK